jgi:hypothetical protein
MGFFNIGRNCICRCYSVIKNFTEFDTKFKAARPCLTPKLQFHVWHRLCPALLTSQCRKLHDDTSSTYDNFPVIRFVILLFFVLNWLHPCSGYCLLDMSKSNTVDKRKHRYHIRAGHYLIYIIPIFFFYFVLLRKSGNISRSGLMEPNISVIM